MSQFSIPVSITNLMHSWPEELWDNLTPAWATVLTDSESAAKIKAAYSASCIDGFAGIAAPLDSEDFKIAFTSGEGEPVRVKAQFLTAVVTSQGMRIELFDTNMTLESGSNSKRTPGYIRLECSLAGLI
ncbi:hypothetical protein CJU35_05630 [Pseudomonas aeruginosa]|uniref:hypothetical protein n=1 Tax=Pseudomonas aeruginosa TaxID=287 RepID=UPI000BB76C28|nr:hypothetical protein [Pseudomonas aeruginosa]PBV09332.1 hypothetical protein CJU35_05630 [Pseudomonas aeruginosa]